MNAAQKKKADAAEIVQKLCANNHYTQDSGVAVLVKQDLRSMGLAQLDRLKTLVNGLKGEK